jgi:hypothetical protein
LTWKATPPRHQGLRVVIPDRGERETAVLRGATARGDQFAGRDAVRAAIVAEHRQRDGPGSQASDLSALGGEYFSQLVISWLATNTLPLTAVYIIIGADNGHAVIPSSPVATTTETC